MKALVINCSPVRDGATAEIVRIVKERLSEAYETKAICINDYRFAFCRGCRACHQTARCVLEDDVPAILSEFVRRMGTLLCQGMCAVLYKVGISR